MAWERVIETFGLNRTAVPGGWLYATHNSLVFVPDNSAAKLGEAYANGYHDGFAAAKKLEGK